MKWKAIDYKNPVQVYAGKWYEFRRFDNFICCDCGLSHDLKIKLKKRVSKRKRPVTTRSFFARSQYDIYMQFARNSQITKYWRKKMGIKELTVKPKKEKSK